MSENTFSFGSGDDHIGVKSKAWKAQGGNTYRLSFAWWELDEEGLPDMGEPGSGKPPLFSGGPVNFIQGAGYIFNKGPEYTKLAGDEPPRQRIATIIVIWPTNKDGAVDQGRFASGDFEVKPWVISSDKYRTLKQIHSEFGFNECDITAKCEEGGTQFQKLTFSPCRESLYRHCLTSPKGIDMAKRITDEVQALAVNIQTFVGRDMTIAAIREKLASGGGSPVQPISGSAAAPDIDSVVTGLLD